MGKLRITPSISNNKNNNNKNSFPITITGYDKILIYRIQHLKFFFKIWSRIWRNISTVYILIWKHTLKSLSLFLKKKAYVECEIRYKWITICKCAYFYIRVWAVNKSGSEKHRGVNRIDEVSWKVELHLAFHSGSKRRDVWCIYIDMSHAHKLLRRNAAELISFGSMMLFSTKISKANTYLWEMFHSVL